MKPGSLVKIGAGCRHYSVAKTATGYKFEVGSPGVVFHEETVAIFLGHRPKWEVQRDNYYYCYVILVGEKTYLIRPIDISAVLDTDSKKWVYGPIEEIISDGSLSNEDR